MKFLTLVFVCLVFFVPFRYFSLIQRRHHNRWIKGCKFDVYSTLMVIDPWGFFSVSRLQWHGTSVYNLWDCARSSHFLHILTTNFCRAWDSNAQHFACESNALINRATTATKCLCYFAHLISLHNDCVYFSFQLDIQNTEEL